MTVSVTTKTQQILALRILQEAENERFLEDGMLLRQHAVTGKAMVSTRRISEAGRMHLEAFTEDELIQQHLGDLQLTSIQPFKEMATVQESIDRVPSHRFSSVQWPRAVAQPDRQLAPQRRRNGIGGRHVSPGSCFRAPLFGHKPVR